MPLLNKSNFLLLLYAIFIGLLFGSPITKHRIGTAASFISHSAQNRVCYYCSTVRILLSSKSVSELRKTLKKTMPKIRIAGHDRENQIAVRYSLLGLKYAKKIKDSKWKNISQKNSKVQKGFKNIQSWEGFKTNFRTVRDILAVKLSNCSKLQCADKYLHKPIFLPLCLLFNHLLTSTFKHKLYDLAT